MSTTSLTKPFPCPFSSCQRSYTRRTKLKEHIFLRKSTPDEFHPVTSPEWESEAVRELLAYQARPANLTEEEKAERKKAAALKCWNKNKEVYRDNQRKAKRGVKEQLQFYQSLVNLGKLDVGENLWKNRVLREIFGTSPPSVEEWIRRDPLDSRQYIIDDSTFPRIVTLFFLYDRWPPTTTSIQPRRILDEIPHQQHYDDLSMLLTLNSSPTIPQEILDTLNLAWERWRPVVTDETLKESAVFNHETETQFRAASSQHDRLASLYHTWLDIKGKATDVLIPKKLSIWELSSAFASQTTQQQNEDTVAQEQVEETAANAMSISEQSRKRPANPSVPGIEGDGVEIPGEEPPIDPTLTAPTSKRSRRANVT